MKQDKAASPSYRRAHPRCCLNFVSTIFSASSSKPEAKYTLATIYLQHLEGAWGRDRRSSVPHHRSIIGDGASAHGKAISLARPLRNVTSFEAMNHACLCFALGAKATIKAIKPIYISEVCKLCLFIVDVIEDFSMKLGRPISERSPKLFKFGRVQLIFSLKVLCNIIRLYYSMFGQSYI